MYLTLFSSWSVTAKISARLFLKVQESATLVSWIKSVQVYEDFLSWYITYYVNLYRGSLEVSCLQFQPVNCILQLVTHTAGLCSHSREKSNVRICSWKVKVNNENWSQGCFMGWWFLPSISCMPLSVGTGSQMPVPGRKSASLLHAWWVPPSHSLCLPLELKACVGEFRVGMGRACDAAPSCWEIGFCPVAWKVFALHPMLSMCVIMTVTERSSPCGNSNRNQLPGLWFLDGDRAQEGFRSLA